VGNQWYWIPDGVNTTPSYAPALVAFVPLDANQVGWVPLGPGDTYAPRYYDDNWQPHYLTRTNVVPAQLVNFGIPGAVTVVPVDAWGRPIDPRNVRRIDQQRLASVRSTLDPLTLTPLRNAVIHSAWGRGKMDLPPGIAKKLNDTRVFVGSDVRESRFRKDTAKWMRVERISDTARNQKFKVKDERQEARQADIGRKPEVDQGRKQDLGRVTAEAKKDNQDAQRQTRQLEQQQRKDARVAERAQVQTQRQSRQAEQQQTRQARIAERAQAQVQVKSQRQAEQQQTRQARVAQRAQVQAQRKSQPKIEQRPQAQRVAQPAKPARSEAKPAPQAAPKQERKQKPPAQPGAQGQGGGGKGKGKKP
jgi:hypothetical protein